MLEEIPGILVRLRTVSIPLAGATPKRLRPPPLSEPGESKPRSGNAAIPRFHLLSYPLRSKSDWKHSDEDTENGVALNSMTCQKSYSNSRSHRIWAQNSTPIWGRGVMFSRFWWRCYLRGLAWPHVFWGQNQIAYHEKWGMRSRRMGLR